MAGRRRAGERRERHVDAVAAHTVLLCPAGTGEERRLMGRAVERVGIILDQLLGPVAVMHVEIHDGDARQPMHRARVPRTDHDVVEQTEAHRLLVLGMMTRRTHGAEGVADLAAGDRIDRTDHGAGGAQGRPAGPRREDGVVVDADPLRPGKCCEHGIDVCTGVHPPDLFQAGKRRIPAVKEMELLRLQRAQHRAQPVGRFRMAFPGVMLQTGRVREQRCEHCLVVPPSVSSSAFFPEQR
jgi:hypothetical protein